MKTSYTVLASASLTCLAACGGGGSSASPADPLGANFSGTIHVDALAISIRLGNPELASAAVLEPVQMAATPFSGALYLLGVPLQPGLNSIRVQGVKQDGSQVERVLAVHNSLTPHAAVELRVAPRVGQAGNPITLTVSPAPELGPIAGVLWDLDGDGVLDVRLPYQPDLPQVFAVPGSYAPSCTIENASGLLFTSSPGPTTLIGVLPDEGLSVENTWLAGVPGLGEIHRHPEADELFALSPADARVFHLSNTGTLLASIDVPGALDPAGFACAENGDLYVADTGNGRVVRLQAASGYALDGGFGAGGALGSHGSGQGQLDAPQDVALLRDPLDDELRICVADLGNARVQVFDELGNLQLEVRGDEQGGLPLQQPVRLEQAGPNAFAVLDRAGSGLRCFDLHGRERVHPNQGAVLPPWTAPIALARDPSGWFWAVFESGTVHVLAADQALVRSFHPPFDVTGMAFSIAGEAQRLVLVDPDTGAGGLHSIVLAQDPPGFEPDAAVAQFAAAVAAADLQGAARACAGSLAEPLAAIFADPQALAELQALVAGITSTHLVEVRGSLAQLISATAIAGAAADIEWLLERSRRDRRWRVLSL